MDIGGCIQSLCLYVNAAANRRSGISAAFKGNDHVLAGSERPTYIREQRRFNSLMVDGNKLDDLDVDRIMKRILKFEAD